jgi:hypothetical protein
VGEVWPPQEREMAAARVAMQVKRYFMGTTPREKPGGFISEMGRGCWGRWEEGGKRALGREHFCKSVKSVNF